MSPRGRPPVGPKMELRLTLEQYAWLDDQRGGTPRPEMIRRLIEQAVGSDEVRAAAQALLTVDQEFTDRLPSIEARGVLGDVAARRWDAMRALIAVLSKDNEHSDGLRCPRCSSTDVVCHGRPHGHECFSCGHDGTDRSDA